MNARILARRKGVGPIVVALGLALTVAACSSGPTYRAATNGGIGYSETRIETNTFRVNYRGSSSTRRETVENFLLRRAAEVTLQNGGDYFIVSAQDTDRRTRFTGTVHSGFFYNAYGFPWAGGRFGRGFGPGFGPGFGTFSSRPIDQYTATALIRIFSGDKPQTNVSAFDARDVLRNLSGPVS